MPVCMVCQPVGRLPGVVTGHLLQKYQHKLPCCMTLRSSELDEVLVVNKAVTEQIQTKAATEGRQRIAISASTTQSLESSAGVLSHAACIAFSMTTGCMTSCMCAPSELLSPSGHTCSEVVNTGACRCSCLSPLADLLLNLRVLRNPAPEQPSCSYLAVQSWLPPIKDSQT